MKPVTNITARESIWYLESGILTNLYKGLFERLSKVPILNRK
jgi:hypothetical protein